MYASCIVVAMVFLGNTFTMTQDSSQRGQTTYPKLILPLRVFFCILGTNVREEPKASVLSAYKICDLAYKILKV